MTDERRARWRVVAADHLKAEVADASDRVKAQTSLAQDALKALLLANGGAMIALFTFIGNVISKAPTVRFDTAHLRSAFILFVGGFVMALIAHVLAFISQDRFFQTTMHEVHRLRESLILDEPVTEQSAALRDLGRGNLAYFGGLLLATLSVIAFGLGCWRALGGVLI